MLQWGRGLSTPEMGRPGGDGADGSPGFNGAGVFRPRKSATATQADASARRFNGAGVFRPRKCAASTCASGASIRFNGAGVFRPRKLPTRGCARRGHWRLQWGRGLSTPEIGRNHGGRDADETASMGPGSFDPGNKQVKITDSRIPRSFNGAGVFRPRKCWRATTAMFSNCLLQWGRGLSTPEIRIPESDGNMPIVLQWGRGLSTPEICVTPTCSCRSWLLQWGRGLSTPEMSFPRLRCHILTCFNGAGVFRPRK